MADDHKPHADVDPGRTTDGDPFASETKHGQVYHRDREAEAARQDASGTVAASGDVPLPQSTADADIPPDNGVRAFFDRTGAVHGSGVGAGGGAAGEDFDDDPATGSGGPAPTSEPTPRE